MNAIFKAKGISVYVLIKNKETRNGVSLEDMDSLVCNNDEKNEAYLYGGRVYLNYYDDDNMTLTIDGVEIKRISSAISTVYGSEFEMKGPKVEQVVAYLNQMERLGVDAFIENYRNKLSTFKVEIEKGIERIESEQSLQYDEKKVPFLTKRKQLLGRLTTIISNLSFHMNAELGNLCYTNAYNEIIKLYF